MLGTDCLTDERSIFQLSGGKTGIMPPGEGYSPLPFTYPVTLWASNDRIRTRL